MSNVQIPNLGAAIALNGTEQLEAVQAGTSVRVTTQQISNFTRGSLDTVAACKVLGRDTASGTGPVQELPIAVDASGNVGIGTSSPLGSAGFGWLTLNGTGGSITSYVANGTETLRVQAEPGFVDLNVRTNVPFIFKTSDTERIRITGAGNVGIGTSSPSVKLDVVGAIQSFASSGFPAVTTSSCQAAGYAPGLMQMTRANASGGATPDNSIIGSLRFDGRDTTNAYALFGAIEVQVGVNASGGAPAFMTFSTSPSGGSVTERMRIDAAGKVGIGTSSPANKLVVNTATQFDGIVLSNNTYAVAYLAGNTATNDEGQLSLNSLGANKVTLRASGDSFLSGGNVGIGTSAPFGYGAGYTSVAVNGSTSGLIDWLANGVRYGTAYNIGAGFAIGNATANPVYFLVNNVERMRIGGDGKVAIGTATPDASAILDVTSTTGGVLFPRMTTTQRDAIGSPANGLVLYNTTTNKLQVRAAGAWVDLH